MRRAVAQIKSVSGLPSAFASLYIRRGIATSPCAQWRFISEGKGSGLAIYDSKLVLPGARPKETPQENDSTSLQSRRREC